MSERVVFVLDDDVKRLETIGRTLGSLHLEVICFIRPAKCLERLRCENCDLVVADLTMCGIDGMDLAAKFTRLKPWIPVIGIIDAGDVTAAVRALRAGVADIVEKPLDEERLKLMVNSLMRENSPSDNWVGRSLTVVETRVLKLIIGDKTNSEMAHLLGRSVRTIEWHRANIMKKLGVDSLLGLIKRSAALGIVDLNITGNTCDNQGESE